MMMMQAFVSTGTSMSLVFGSCANGYTGDGGCDFDKDHGKVSPLSFSLSLSCCR